MFRLATSFAQCQKGVMLIDELEAAIHTTALEQFIDWIVEVAQELNVQVFATTHSLECIDTILGSSTLNKENLSLFRLRQQADLVTCKEIEGETLERLRYELGQDVR
jgi:AAA15 family ATPase/GTPase